ncbi:MAG: HAD family hydrolase [Anaerolineales bacterium]|nr:MAG: HAD family hydrolase [Anaerolineales bacterium]
MTDHIEAILFDMGGTLRGSIQRDEASKLRMVSRIIDLLGAEASPDEFAELLTARATEYGRWARESRTELNEGELWTKWMLPDWPADKIGEIAVSLNQHWREATGERTIFPETRDVVLALFRSGYRLGLVSNTVSSVEVPRELRQLELSGCFETVILSCVVGLRKPDPAILLEATRRMGVKPERCAYIGDRLNRDVQAAREANFAKVVILRDPETFAAHQSNHPDLISDHYVDNLRELLDIFPARPNSKISSPVLDASLSTMWAKKNFPTLPDFFEATRRLGFARIELNHQVDSAMLAGIDLGKYQFSSVHEPCPADISTEELKNRDWLISSPDGDKRKRGVEAIKRSIDLAQERSASIIIVHCGNASADLTLEKRLRMFFEAGITETDEYRDLKQSLIESRAAIIGPRFKAVKESLLELLAYAGQFHIRLGLENRYHYFDIPTPDEMGELLALASPDQLGFIYDVGHAEVMQRLGFFSHEIWLQRFADRISGVHLHDVCGLNDHYAPGLGDVDFQRVASQLPRDAFRTCELQGFNSTEQIKNGLQVLIETGCIKLS